MYQRTRSLLLTSVASFPGGLVVDNTCYSCPEGYNANASLTPAGFVCTCNDPLGNTAKCTTAAYTGQGT